MSYLDIIRHWLDTRPLGAGGCDVRGAHWDGEQGEVGAGMKHRRQLWVVEQKVDGKWLPTFRADSDKKVAKRFARHQQNLFGTPFRVRRYVPEAKQ